MGQRCTLAADLYSFGLLLVELTTQQLVTRRGKWRWPRVPQECPQACAAQRSASLACCGVRRLPFQAGHCQQSVLAARLLP